MTTKPSMGRRLMKSWDEQDAYTGWRKVLCYLQYPGVRKSIKRRTHRRERREAKRATRRGDE